MRRRRRAADLTRAKSVAGCCLCCSLCLSPNRRAVELICRLGATRGRADDAKESTRKQLHFICLTLCHFSRLTSMCFARRSGLVFPAESAAQRPAETLVCVCVCDRCKVCRRRRALFRRDDVVTAAVATNNRVRPSGRAQPFVPRWLAAAASRSRWRLCRAAGAQLQRRTPSTANANAATS